MAGSRGSRRQQLGWRFERRALAYLRRAGLHLVTRNYHCRHGEIDLILTEDAVLVLVEVRYRASASHGGPLASVTPAKQRRLAQTACDFVSRHIEYQALPMRFDVLGMTAEPHISWIKDAFRPGFY